MTADRPDGRPRPFGPDELDGVAGIRPDELAAEARLARDIEGVSARGGVKSSPDFTDRVMGAVAAEPLPAPVIAAGSALRRGAALGLLASIRDSFRVAFGGGFPVAARAQALALVLLVTGVLAGSGLATAGAVGLLDDRGSPSPAPTVAAPSPSEQPTATPMPTDTPDATPEDRSPSATPSSDPGESEATETEGPDETDDPARTTEPENEGGTPTARPTVSPTDRPTARPTARPTPSPTARPTASPTDHPDETETPKPTDTPDPDDTPSPNPTADSD